MADPKHEVTLAQLTRDTRSSGTKLFAFLFLPGTFKWLMLGGVFIALLTPGLWPVWTVIVLTLVVTFACQDFAMPLRMPKDVGGFDSTDFVSKLVENSYLFGLIRKSRTVKKLLLAGGILYLGHLRTTDPDEDGRELWLNNSDARTHLFIPGTTGSGKTEALLGLFYNSICWGSGACYTDGKGSARLPFAHWSLCRRLGREDDFLILNLLPEEMDPFQKLVAKQASSKGQRLANSQSNSLNSFAEGSAEFLLQLFSSLLPVAHGDSAAWQEKAINLLDAILRSLCYKRAKGELDISIKEIRHHLALHNLVQLYLEGRDGKLPELAYLPIKAYFETGLAGFNPALAHDPNQWDPEVYNQHGFLTSQFARILSMIMDTYGYIFDDKYPDIDLLDVLLNNRILVVLIPSLSKSAQEAAALGKLFVSSVRLMMAQNLGYRLEGTKADILDSLATNSPNPYLLIWDELSYYFAAGLAVMFAQARELGFCNIAGVQDVQGLKRGDAKAEAASLIANTKVKWALALEDPEETFDLIRKAGGDAYYSMLAGYDGSTGAMANSYEAQSGATIQRKDRISITDLKRLNSGEGFVIFKESVVPSAAFYLPDDQKLTATLSPRINQFIQVEKPSLSRIPPSAIRMGERQIRASTQIRSHLRTSVKPYYPNLDDPILSSLVEAAALMNRITRFDVSASERGVVLFEAARRALHSAKEAGRTAPYHEPHFDDPPELFPSDAEDVGMPA